MAEPCVDQAKIVCSICLEDFVNPKLLPCFHTFCLLCLESYIERVQARDKFDCPLCRVMTDIPKGGVAKFQSNFYIQSTSRKANGDVTCDVCEDKTAANTCFDCDQNLCTECTKYHQRVRATREHKLCELTQEKGGTTGKIKTHYFCKHHPKEEIKMVCIDCDTELCLVCKLTDHENHSTKDVKNMAIDKRKEIGVMVEKVDGDIRKIDATIDTIKQKLTDAKKLKDENLNTLENQTRLYLQKVYKNKDKLKELIDKSYEEDSDQLKAFLNNLEHAQTHTKQLSLIAKNIEETADDVAVISLGAQFKQRLGEVEKLDPDVLDKLCVKQLKFIKTEVPEVTMGIFDKETMKKEETEVRPGPSGQIPSKVTTSSAPPISAVLKPSGWSCDFCSISNKDETDKCAACQTLRPGPKKITANAPKAVPKQDDPTAKLKRPLGQWECEVCLIHNKPNVSACAACQSLKPKKRFKHPTENISRPGAPRTQVELEVNHGQQNIQRAPDGHSQSQMHSGKALKDFTCRVCGKSFLWNYLLKRHMVQHTGEKPFKCHVCFKGFTTKGYVHRHMLLHVKDK